VNAFLILPVFLHLQMEKRRQPADLAYMAHKAAKGLRVGIRHMSLTE